MSEPLMQPALDRFVESLTPQAYKTAGVKPTHIDASLTPEEYRAIGEALLQDYDKVGLGWMKAKVGLEAEVAALTTKVATLQAEINAPKLLLPSTGTPQTASGPTGVAHA